jgi:hypothetical protein
MESQTIGYEAVTLAEAQDTDVRGIDVYCWRLEELLGAGYGHALADHLAGDGRIDLHLACDLLARGCDQATALRILS